MEANTVRFISNDWSHLLNDFNGGSAKDTLSHDRLQEFSDSISRKIKLDRCWGFLGWMLREVEDPEDEVLRESCKDNIRAPGTTVMKYQAVVGPDGLIYNLYRPRPGSWAAQKLLDHSRVLDRAKDPALGQERYLLADNCYLITTLCLTPFDGINDDEDSNKVACNRAFNTARMNGLRAIEGVEMKWKGLRKRKVRGDSCERVWFKVATILANCVVCAKGSSKTGDYSDCRPPTPKVYLNRPTVNGGLGMAMEPEN